MEKVLASLVRGLGLHPAKLLRALGREVLGQLFIFPPSILVSSSMKWSASRVPSSSSTHARQPQKSFLELEVLLASQVREREGAGADDRMIFM